MSFRGGPNVRQRIKTLETTPRARRPGSILSAATDVSTTPRGRRPGRGGGAEFDRSSTMSSMTDTSQTPRASRPGRRTSQDSVSGVAQANPNKYPAWEAINSVTGIEEVPPLVAGTVTGKGLYLFGGMDPDGFPLSALWLALPSDRGIVFKEIHPKDELPARAEATIFVRGDSLFIFGGRDEQDYAPDVWRYNFKTKTVELFDCSNPPPYGLGYSFTPTADGGYLFGDGQLHHLKIGARSGTWKEVDCKGDIPDVVSGQTVSATDAELVMFGGFDSTGAPLDYVWRYNISSRTWRESTAPDPPTPRGYASSTIVNGRFYVCGGSAEELDYDPQAIHDMLVLDLAKNKWKALEGCDEFVGDQLSQLLVHNNIMYLVSGNNGLNPIQRRSVPVATGAKALNGSSRPKTSSSSSSYHRPSKPVKPNPVLDAVVEMHDGDGEYERVFDFLRRSGFGHLSSHFERQQVDDFAFELLRQERVSRETMAALGITTVGQQLRFIAALENE